MVCVVFGCLFLVLCVCVLFVFGVFCFVFGSLVFGVLFCFLDERDSAWDYVSVLHQFTFAATTATAFA